LETPQIDPISGLPSVSRWKEFLGGGKGRMEAFLQEFNHKVEKFNQKMERFSEALNKIWSRDDEVVLVLKKKRESHPGQGI
jgi:hypothetical protein